MKVGHSRYSVVRLVQYDSISNVCVLSSKNVKSKSKFHLQISHVDKHFVASLFVPDFSFRPCLLSVTLHRKVIDQYHDFVN